MTLDDTLDLILSHFAVERTGVDNAGNPEYDLGGDTPFVVTETDDQTLRLAAVLQTTSNEAALTDIAERLLEANCQGAETGTGQIAYVRSLGAICLVDFLEVQLLDQDLLKYRLVDFMLYAEFWRSAESPIEQAYIRSKPGSGTSEETMIRI